MVILISHKGKNTELALKTAIEKKYWDNGRIKTDALRSTISERKISDFQQSSMRPEKSSKIWKISAELIK